MKNVGVSLRMTMGSALLLAAVGGCSAGALSDSKPGGAPPGQNPGNPAPGGGAAPGPGPGSGAGGAAGMGGTPQPPPPPPPETEERRDFDAPRAGARFVYVANPRRDTVAVIDSTSLAIRSVDVGDTPGTLRTLPGRDVAIVINGGSRDATILRTEATGGTRTTTVPVVAGANALAIAPDGLHAIAWFNSADRNTASPGATGGSFQDVSVITLGQPDQSVPLTVGFRPTDVTFASDGSAAFVITEDGVSVIRFAEVRGPAVAPLVRLGDAALAPPATMSPDAGAPPAAATTSRDVSVTPDGKFALARREGSPQILLVDLATRAATTVDLGSPVTDLDLSPRGDFALAVLRQTGTVVRLALPGGFSDAAQRRSMTIAGAGTTIGSAALGPDGKTAVLYTTATPVERVVLLNVDSAAVQVVPLKKGVRSVALAPDGRTALVLHTKDPGDPRQAGIDVEVAIDRAYGYSVVDLGTGFAKLQLTEAAVGDLAITPDSSRAFVLLRDDMRSVRIAQRIHLTSFIVSDFPLGSPPQALAALADSKRIFVSQAHPEGRISFIHWETDAVESVTGFELNGRIVQ
jgi:hypothetical protein